MLSACAAGALILEVTVQRLARLNTPWLASEGRCHQHAQRKMDKHSPFKFRNPKFRKLDTVVMTSTTQSLLLTHSLDYSEEEMLVGPELMEELKLKIGDFVEICSLAAESQQPATPRTVRQAQPHAGAPLVLRVTTSAPGKSALRLSILKSVAEAFTLSARQTVKLRRVDVQEAALDWVEWGFKDQYVTRGDIWMLRRHLVDQKPTVYLGKTIAFEGVRASVQGMMRQGAPTASGLLDEGTKLRFRSRSAAFFILIQMSREMWEEAPDGEHFQEKAIAFLQSLFRRWADLGVSHTLSLVLFSRCYLSPSSAQGTPSANTELPPGAMRDRAGRVYTDYYKLVTENESRSDWQPLITTLKREFMAYVPSLKLREPSPPLAQPGSPIVLGLDSIGGSCGVSACRVSNCGDTGFLGSQGGMPTSAAGGSGGSAGGTTKLHSSVGGSGGSGVTFTSGGSGGGATFASAADGGGGGGGGAANWFSANNSDAAHGNLHEAINLALDVLENSREEQDLASTAKSVVVISPGSGWFEVDYPLSQITKQRMTDNGIGCDLVCCGSPPLHTVPLFT